MIIQDYKDKAGNDCKAIYACSGCRTGYIQQVGPDGLDFCTNCERIVEGQNNIYIDSDTEEEIEI